MRENEREREREREERKRERESMCVVKRVVINIMSSNTISNFVCVVYMDGTLRAVTCRCSSIFFVCMHTSMYFICVCIYIYIYTYTYTYCVCVCIPTCILFLFVCIPACILFLFVCVGHINSTLERLYIHSE